MENNFRPKENFKSEEKIKCVDGDFSLHDVEFQENTDESLSTTVEGKTTEIKVKKENGIKAESFYVPLSSRANNGDDNGRCFYDGNNENSSNIPLEHNRTNAVDETDKNTVLTTQCGVDSAFLNVAPMNCAKKKSDKKPYFVFSMLGLLLSVFYIGFPFAVTGLVMAKIKKKKGECDELIKESIVLGYAGIAIGLFTLVIFAFCLIF